MSGRICDPSFGIFVSCRYCSERTVVHKCHKHKQKIPERCPNCGRKDWVKTRKYKPNNRA